MNFPGPIRTSSGALLPFVALPQTEILTVNVNGTPLIRDALGSGVHFQPLRLDVEAGVWLVLATFSPGAVIPLHYHTGIAEVYTLSGKWYYLEYPEQPQTAGSYLFEPAASTHTFVCPESNTEDTVILVRVEGANVNFSEDGSYHSILDAAALRYLTEELAKAQGLGPVDFISGGTAENALK
ncbi:2,4'-dihydroxyacetophenone dioxygenase family protein [Nocardia sp. NPDC059228]|uniref:2,4'-dihydroxyacetophenone dioxygenase family protein n=1 Tax=Nocardia sp. NPDC059228 TaxID=3346777 RepID=UPI003695EE8D